MAGREVRTVSISYLDTHVAVWLHDGLVGKLTQAARREIERSDLLLSPMAYLEMDYLWRRKRIGVRAAKMYANLNGTFGVVLCSFPFPAVVSMAMDCEWTADPFDKLIVGQSMANEGSRLITADELVRSKYRRAVW